MPATLHMSTSVEPIFERPPSRSSTSPPPTPPKYFSNLRPVFLPPPFTPSHPVFTHLASIAAHQSQAIRNAAEEYMTEQSKAKISEIEKADADIRRNVESLWHKFREGVSLIQTSTSIPSRPKEQQTANGFEPSSSAMATRDFIPAAVSPATFSPASAPRISALSASLVTSSFHHPQARASRTSPSPSGRSTSETSNHSNESVRSKSLTSAVPQSPEGSNVLKYRRNLQETVDYATSYKYFIDHEKDIIQLRGRRVEKEESQDDSERTKQNGPSHPLADTKASDATPKKQSVESHTTIEKSDQKPEVQETENSPSPTRGREKSSKGKKVTFVAEPAIVTIQRDVDAEKDEALGNQEQAQGKVLVQIIIKPVEHVLQKRFSSLSLLAKRAANRLSTFNDQHSKFPSSQQRRRMHEDIDRRVPQVYQSLS